MDEKLEEMESRRVYFTWSSDEMQLWRNHCCMNKPMRRDLRMVKPEPMKLFLLEVNLNITKFKLCFRVLDHNKLCSE